MGIPKFKVGDKVRVLRASTEGEHNLWMDSWTPRMNQAIGNEYTIKRCTVYGVEEDNALYHKYVLNDFAPLNFPEFVLQNKMVAGQQLLFDFMSKE